MSSVTAVVAAPGSVTAVVTDGAVVDAAIAGAAVFLLMPWVQLAAQWDVPPSLIATIASGDVYEYTYQGTTRYRLVPSPYLATLDAFYSAFDGAALSGLITARGGTLGGLITPRGP